MDSVEPEQTPFAAVSAQTSKLGRVSLCDADRRPCTNYCKDNIANNGIVSSNIKHTSTSLRPTLHTDG
jgi:hypothetical protein